MHVVKIVLTDLQYVAEKIPILSKLFFLKLSVPLTVITFSYLFLILNLEFDVLASVESVADLLPRQMHQVKHIIGTEYFTAGAFLTHIS
jgi:hypothetical protein